MSAATHTVYRGTYIVATTPHGPLLLWHLAPAVQMRAQLVRVAAHEATSVLITMTERDKEEQDLSLNADGLPTIGNSATLRTLLALRNVM